MEEGHCIKGLGGGRQLYAQGAGINMLATKNAESGDQWCCDG